MAVEERKKSGEAHDNVHRFIPRKRTHGAGSGEDTTSRTAQAPIRRPELDDGHPPGPTAA